MKFIYSLGIRFYGLAIFIASLFNDKAKKWRLGRKDIFQNLQKALQNNKSPIAWFHCASLGEFEQGRPVIEEFKQKFPQYKILLTFFSPSGYEMRKDYASADYIFYLPLDTVSNAKRFVEIVKPSVTIFVKYEFWHNYLNQLQQQGVPTYLISAVFRADQYFFKWYGKWFKDHLKDYKRIFVQDTDSEKILKSAGVSNVELAGDTRLDRVIALSEQAKTDAIIEEFKGSGTLWICGSTWAEDEKHILPVYNQLQSSGEKIKLLLVPHEINESHISQMLQLFSAVKYSAVNANDVKGANVLVVDKMGLLASLYRYADVAYIGGGFGDGIHSLLEAVVYDIPVVFGPNHKKFNEAIGLIKVNGGFAVSSTEELQKRINRLVTDDTYRENCGEAAKAYVWNRRGATQKIMAELELILKCN
ncbi:MAG TPA: glycosyltransferase N-terminal domain-containing protein [Bacteroidia bacterium]|jgi:3-deoxy-D-manno-octulosonic-acid transferase|nr:glycosyltransferase N-terminal domain-containing protein [Bacteroidia bacterium]